MTVGHGMINIGLEITTARPEDNALNIQYGHLLSRTNAGGPHTFISPMDNPSPHQKLTMLNMLLPTVTWTLRSLIPLLLQSTILGNTTSLSLPPTHVLPQGRTVRL